ncbi:MAG: rod shape-determining protein RodA [Spirochaetota bacterium]
MRERSSVFSVDVLLIAATLVLMTVGVLFIYSSGVTSDGASFSREWIRQIVWVSLGLLILVGVASFDYERLRDLAPYLYAVLIVVLIGTLLFGRVVNGARSWIGIGAFGVQPAEFMKVATILLLARFLETHGQSICEPRTFGVAFLIALVPTGLILLQPDLGTALVYLPILLVMAYVAGAKTSYILFIVLTGMLMIVLTVLPAWEQEIHGADVAFVSIVTDRRLFLIVAGALLLVGVLSLVGLLVLKRGYFRWLIYSVAVVLVGLGGSVVGRRMLREYQLMRLIVFLDPNIDPRGAGWNIIQSVTAVGSGGIAGKGWLRGTQSHLQYLPEQSTDFIFSILAEEWGFAGALVVFACFSILMLRGLMISAKAKDNFASLASVGIVTMIFFHVAVNVGMAIGIMPVTGIPLLFLSYGGSSLWTALTGVGLLMSFHNRRYRY